MIVACFYNFPLSVVREQSQWEGVHQLSISQELCRRKERVHGSSSAVCEKKQGRTVQPANDRHRTRCKQGGGVSVTVCPDPRTRQARMSTNVQLPPRALHATRQLTAGMVLCGALLCYWDAASPKNLAKYRDFLEYRCEYGKKCLPLLFPMGLSGARE